MQHVGADQFRIHQGALAQLCNKFGSGFRRGMGVVSKNHGKPQIAKEKEITNWWILAGNMAKSIHEIGRGWWATRERGFEAAIMAMECMVDANTIAISPSAVADMLNRGSVPTTWASPVAIREWMLAQGSAEHARVCPRGFLLRCHGCEYEQCYGRDRENVSDAEELLMCSACSMMFCGTHCPHCSCAYLPSPPIMGPDSLS